MPIVIALVAALTISLSAPIILKPLLARSGVIDVPTARSSHTRPVIRGVGLAPLLAVAVGYAILVIDANGAAGADMLIVVLGVSLAAGLLGLAEDARGLTVRVRAATQLGIGLAGASLISVNSAGGWWEIPILALGIAAYINVANFMDGVDGISGLHGAVVGTVYAGFGMIVGIPWLSAAGWILALSFLGFLPWNLARGGVFLGDVGSYLLGGGIAIVAVAAFSTGLPIVAILGPLLIYLADAGVTLGRRVARGDRWFEAHRSHVYQRLSDLGLSHIQVAVVVAGASLLTGGLGLLSLLAPRWAWICVVLMALVVLAYFSLCAILERPHRQTRNRRAAHAIDKGVPAR